MNAVAWWLVSDVLLRPVLFPKIQTVSKHLLPYALNLVTTKSTIKEAYNFPF